MKVIKTKIIIDPNSMRLEERKRQMRSQYTLLFLNQSSDAFTNISRDFG